MPVFDAIFKGQIILTDPGAPPQPIEPPHPIDPLPSGDQTLLKSTDLEYIGSYVPDGVNEGTYNYGNYSWGVPAFVWIDGAKHMYLRGTCEKINGWPEWPSLVL